MFPRISRAFIGWLLALAGAGSIVAAVPDAEEAVAAPSEAGFWGETIWGRIKDLRAQEQACREQLNLLPLAPVSQQSERIGWHSQFSQTTQATKWLQVDLGKIQPFDSVTLVPVDVAYQAYAGPGFGFPVRFLVEVSDDPSFSNPRLLEAFDEADQPNPGGAPIFISCPEARGRCLRVTATRLWPRSDLALLVLGEVFVLRGDENLAAGAAVTVSDAYNNPPAWQPDNATDGQTVLGPPIDNTPAPGNGWHAELATSPDTVKWVQVDLGREMPLDEVRLYPARPKDFPARRGFGFPLRFRVDASATEDFAAPILLRDETAEDFVNPAENPVFIRAEGRSARYVRMTATRLWARNNDYIFALAELEVWSGGHNVALGAKVTALDSIGRGSWADKYLVDGFTSQGRIVPLGQWLSSLAKRREFEMRIARLGAARRELEAERDRWVVLGCAGLAALVLVSLGVGSRMRTRARRLEVERLRQRIASDLHDEIGSNLGSIALLSQMALRQPAEAQGDLTEINRVARETAESMRDLVWFIQPAAAASGDFAVKLRETAANLLAGMEWEFEVTPLERPLALEFKRQVFLLFKEALNNVRRHAQASVVTIRVADADDIFSLEIEDNGQGFSSEGESSGMGLASMRQRAGELGGNLVVDSTVGSGTKITLAVKMTSRWRSAAP